MTPDSINLPNLLMAGTFCVSLASLAYSVLFAPSRSEVRELKSQLKEESEKLIDQKLIVLESKQGACSKVHDQQITQIMLRLERGDERFAKLEAASHKVEIDLLRSLNELKDVVATKDDLDRLREEINRG